MNQPVNSKAITGILFWLAIVCVVCWLFVGKSGESEVVSKLKGYFGKQPVDVELWSSEYQMMAFGDPIFLESQDSTVRIGNVSYIDFGEGFEEYKKGDTKTAIAVLYGNAPALSPGDYVLLHQTGQSMAWVIKTMLPPEMRERIGKLIIDAWQENEEQLVSSFRPLIEKSLHDASAIVREDFQKAIERHREEVDVLAARFQKDLLEKELMPLVREEIWPIVHEESQPLAETIGREIWQEVSVLRFGWRFIYDRSPLPEKNLTEQEFNRFLKNKAIPILEDHMDDFVDVQKQALMRISKNDVVKQTVSASIRKVADDPDVQQLFGTIMREVFLENERLRESIRSNWESPQARQAIASASSRLDPTIIQIGQELFGSTTTAITPEFAQVLRNKVLHKDERWLTLHTKSLNNRDEDMAKLIVENSDELARLKNEEGLLRLPIMNAPADGEIPLAVLPGESEDGDDEDDTEAVDGAAEADDTATEGEGGDGDSN